MKLIAILFLLLNLAAASIPIGTSNEGAAVSFGDAAKYCLDLNEATFTDWQIPTLEELMYASDGADEDFLWTSTTDGEFYLAVRFSDGKIIKANGEKLIKVRCVRY